VNPGGNMLAEETFWRETQGRRREPHIVTGARESDIRRKINNGLGDHFTFHSKPAKSVTESFLSLQVCVKNKE